MSSEGRRFPAGEPLRTYSHLAAARKVPDDYELTTTALHYYRTHGIGVRTPIRDWYAKYQEGSALQCSNWDLFVDPARTTYSRYTAVARQREAHVDGILRSMDMLGYDSRLAETWLSSLDRIVGPLRYPLHGLQMVTSYAASMAPGSRVTIALMFQTGHEMRRIQRLTYRMVHLRGVREDFGVRAKTLWQDDPSWQPLRKLIEQLLVTYDWGESFVALNLCVKPLMDDLFTSGLAAAAARRGDTLFAEMLASFWEDALWQRSWTRALVDVLVRDRPENEAVISSWTSRWLPETKAALEPFAFIVADGRGAHFGDADRTRPATGESLGDRR